MIRIFFTLLQLTTLCLTCVKPNSSELQTKKKTLCGTPAFDDIYADVAHYIHKNDLKKTLRVVNTYEKLNRLLFDKTLMGSVFQRISQKRGAENDALFPLDNIKLDPNTANPSNLIHPGNVPFHARNYRDIDDFTLKMIEAIHGYSALYQKIKSLKYGKKAYLRKFLKLGENACCFENITRSIQDFASEISNGLDRDVILTDLSRAIHNEGMEDSISIKRAVSKTLEKKQLKKELLSFDGQIYYKDVLEYLETLSLIEKSDFEDLLTYQIDIFILNHGLIDESLDSILESFIKNAPQPGYKPYIYDLAGDVISTDVLFNICEAAKTYLMTFYRKASSGRPICFSLL